MKKGFPFDTLLVLLLFAVFLKGLVWAAFVPLWQFPDEQAHFAQISHFGETGKMPPTGKYDLSKEILISERLLGTERDEVGNNKYTYHPEFNIPYSQSPIGLFEKEISNIPHTERKEMVRFEAASYPPLYYWLASIFYTSIYDGSLFDRVFAVRMFNVLLSVLYAFVCFAFFKELFPSWNIKALVATVVVVFHPMFSFVSSGINSDNLFNLLYLVAMYLAASILYRPLKLKDTVLMLLVFLLAIKTKPHGFLILSVYSFPILLKFFRKELPLPYSASIVFGSIAVISKIFADVQAGRQILPDVSLSYLVNPNLSVVDHGIWTLKHTYREILPWYWGVFRWLSLALPRDINRLINRVLLIGILAVFFGFVKALRKREFQSILPILYLAYVTVSYFVILFVWDYLFTRSHGFSFGIQGRYYFPTLAAHIGLLMWGFFSLYSKQWYQRGVIVVATVAMILLNTVALYTVVSSYFSMKSVQLFFIQASQYKPILFKSPWLELYIACYSFSIILLCVYFIQSIFKYNESH